MVLQPCPAADHDGIQLLPVPPLHALKAPQQVLRSFFRAMPADCMLAGILCRACPRLPSGMPGLPWQPISCHDPAGRDPAGSVPEITQTDPHRWQNPCQRPDTDLIQDTNVHA